jgi:outer membrane protein OmpA-like peptidoglycan-associated protein
MHFRFACCLIFCILLSAFKTSAQDASAQQTRVPEYYIGVLSGYSYIQNQTTLSIIPGATDCGTFKNGTANGYFLGISADYPLFPELYFPEFLQASGRILFSARPVELQTTNNNNFQVFNAETGQYEPLVRDHNYTGALKYVLFDIGVRIQPLSWLPVYTRFAFDAGNPVAGTSYEQYEQIASPSFALYSDDTKRRITGNGEIVGAGTAYGAIAALGAEFPFQNDLFINGEISYRKGLNSVIATDDWRTNMIQASVGIRYGVFKETAKQPQPEREHITPQTPPLVVQSINTKPLEVQETIVTQTFPLLPYIFFDSTRTELRPQYIHDTPNRDNFKETELLKSTLPIYYNLLNIVGKRLQDNPRAKITLTGTTDGREFLKPEERKKLAETRAAKIAEILKKEWNIAANRITIQTRDVPELASSTQYTEGNEENRRVEIFSNDPKILAPVVHSRFQELVPVEDEQKFSVAVLNPDKAQAWDISIFYKDKLVAIQRQEGVPPKEISLSLAQTALSNIGTEVESLDSLRGEIQVIQNDGSVITAQCPFPFLKTQNQFELGRLSLIVFDFDKAEITPLNKLMVNQFVNEAIKPTSQATIVGSTDRLGEAKYNVQLSQQRAEIVQKYLVQLKPETKITSVTGTGASMLPYDNSLPEGRYYCRTVSLTVKTPVLKK